VVIVEPVNNVVNAPTQTGESAEVAAPAPKVAAEGAAEVISGRVTTLVAEDTDDIASIRILDGPDYGNVTVNPDNSFAVVMTTTDYVGGASFNYEATYVDGTTEVFTTELNVTEGLQQAGWGTGDFYMLETDENDKVIVEHGDNHREVYVSGSDEALTLADIARLEDVNINQVNGKFLSLRPEYGGTEGMALDAVAGETLWRELVNDDAEPGSHWLLFERGYEYEDLDGLYFGGAEGESELHPLLMTSYGEGDKPVLHGDISFFNDLSTNVVFQDLQFADSISALAAGNLLIDDASFKDAGLFINNVEGFTLRNAQVIDNAREAPADGEYWEPVSNRVFGIFVNKSDGVLIENTFWDHNGWEDDYDYDLSADGGQPPSQYSHNLYIQHNNEDVTFRDSITMRAAFFGVQIRSGGFVEDNLILDNNAGLNTLGGDYNGAGPIGNYSLYTDNVVTSAQHLETAKASGATGLGIVNNGLMTTLLDNIVAHAANPDDPSELADKISVQGGAVQKDDPFYDDTIVYNWVGSAKYDEFEERSQNHEGLDRDVLDETTIQNFTAQLLGKEDATIADLADVLRAQADGALDDVVDADLIIAYFQQGFGVDVNIRSEAEVLRFVPNDLGDGVRWDNRINWTTEDLPGTQDGDSVDLGGNWVQYGGTTTIEDLDFGSGGTLNVTHGKLEVADHIATGEAGGEFSIDSAGQVWVDGYTDKDVLTINAEGGRFANTDLLTGTVDVNVSDNAQVILASDGADFVLNEDSSLEITGGDAKVGFDGQDGDTGVLLLADDATLSFTAEDGELSTIEEFRSGAFEGAAPDIQSGINLGNANLELNLDSLSGGGATTEILIDVDEVIGNFEDITITGLGGNQDATVTVDYSTDQVLLNLTKAGNGSGNVSVTTVGNADNAKGASELWDALTNGHGIYVDDDPADIPSEEDVPAEAL